jgi:hypothetical protein
MSKSQNIWQQIILLCTTVMQMICTWPKIWTLLGRLCNGIALKWWNKGKYFTLSSLSYHFSPFENKNYHQDIISLQANNLTSLSPYATDLKWFLTSKSFYRSPFSKWPPQYRTNSTLFDFNVLNWFPTLNNFYRSPFSKWPPQCRKNSTLFDFKGSF